MSLVLVADDEPAVLDALCGVLEDLGHEVVQARNGQEALELTRRRQPALVITDHMMPHLSGIELCRRLKADRLLAEIPVLLLSGATDHGTPAADAFLPKPFELAEFEALIQRLLRSAHHRAAALPPPPPPGSERASSLLQWVAHEMRNPLSAARMQLHQLERSEGQADSAARGRPLQAVRRQLSSLEVLAGVLADTSELIAGPLRLMRKPTEMGALVGEVVGGWQSRLAKPELHFSRPPTEAELSVDPGRISLALEVLIGNAVKHGGKEHPVEVALELAEPHLAIRVTDHGPGIPAQKLESLFAGFEPNQGRGLELHVASEIARAHGGGITARSEKGRGTTFTLSLPRS